MSENKPSTSGLSSIDLSKLPRGAISMAGTPLGRNARLPSIKGPRDLTLGSGNKRVFTPNIPVRREKKAPQPNVSSAPSRKQAAENNKDSRSRRRQKNFVQLPGAVFGDGVSNLPKAATIRDVSGPSSSTPQKPVFKPESMVKKERFDEEDEAELSDKFVDDSDLGEDDESMAPVAIPLAKNKCIKKEAEDNDVPDAVANSSNIATVIKKEPVEIKENELEQEMADKLWLKQDAGILYLLEFPDHFVHPTQNNEPSSLPEGANNGAAPQPPTPASSSSHWSSTDEGCIGKLQILRSGEYRLVLGSETYEVFNKTPSLFLEQVVSVKTEDNAADVSLLGNITQGVRLLPSFNQNSVKT